MEDKPERGPDEARRRARSAYDQLRGHLWGLSIDSWSKTQLLGSLDTVYEQALMAADLAAQVEALRRFETSAPSAKGGSPSSTAESA